MPFPLAAALGFGSTVLGLLGKKKSEDAKTKQAQEAARLKREAAIKKHGVTEKARISGLKGLQSSVGARGIKGGLESFDPAMFEERPFTGEELPQETGNSFFGDVLATGSGLAGAAASQMSQEQQQDERQAELDRIMCALNPAACPIDSGFPAPTYDGPTE